MADLESVLADVSYLIALDTAKTEPISIVNRKINLPHPCIDSAMKKYLAKRNSVNFYKIFHEPLGYETFKQFCLNSQDENIVKKMKFYAAIITFQQDQDTSNDQAVALKIYSDFILQEVLEDRHEFPSDYPKKLVTSFEENKFYLDIYDNYKKDLEKKLGESFDDYKASDFFIRYLQWKLVEATFSPSIEEFSIHRIIGRGGFGEVYGCHKNDTGKMFAMKCIDKKRMKVKDGIQLAINERNILSTLNSPFIVCMSYCFQTSDKICFILDLMNGGDLNYHASKKGNFTEDMIKFYAAEILLGLEYLHSKYIMYRDLKPANILLDNFGHVRISDLGLACDYTLKKITACVGTPGYIAPEVLKKGCAYDCSCDLFSFGCLIYKLVVGYNPFKTNKRMTKDEVNKLVLNEEPKYPDNLSDSLKSLIQGLLIKDPTNRLGSSESTDKSIRDHPFFMNIDWVQAYSKKLTPPFIPPFYEVNAADATEIGNFNEDETRNVKLGEEDKLLYNMFEFVHPELWQAEISKTIFDHINSATDKLDQKRLINLKDLLKEIDNTDYVLYGILQKQAKSYLPIWQKRIIVLYPNRIEWFAEIKSPKSVLPIDHIKAIRPSHNLIIKIETSTKNMSIRCENNIEYSIWLDSISEVLNKYQTIEHKNINLNISRESVSESPNFEHILHKS